MKNRPLIPILITLVLLIMQPFQPLDAQSPTFTLILFREADSLTLYIADAGGTVALRGLVLSVNGTPYRLDQYPSFQGLPLDRMPTPLSLRLQVGANTTVP